MNIRVYLNRKAWRLVTQEAPKLMGSMLVLQSGWYPTLDTRFFPEVPYETVLEVMAMTSGEGVTLRLPSPLETERVHR